MNDDGINSETFLLKNCALCGDDKPFVEFGDHALTKDGKQGRCRPCMALYSRLRYAWKSGKISEAQFRDELVKFQVERIEARMRENPDN